MEGGTRSRGGRGARRRARGAADRGRPRHAGDPGRDRGDLAAHRARRDACGPAAAGRRRPGVSTRAGCRSRRARRCSPASRPDRPTDALDRRSLPPARRPDGGRRAGGGRACGRRRADHHRRHRAPALARRHRRGRAPSTACGPRRACIRTRRRTASTGWPTLLGEPEVVAVGECGLDYHYDHSPRDVQRDVFAAQIRLGHDARPAARDPHPRGVGRHVRRARGRGRPAADRVPLLLRRGPRGRAGLDHRRLPVVRRDRHVPERRRHPRGRAALCPLDRLLVETDAPVPGARAPPGQAQPARPGARGRARRSPRSRVWPPTAVAEATWATQKPCLASSDPGNTGRGKFAFALRRP